MSLRTSKTIFKTNFNKHRTKSKKIKFPFSYDLEEIDKKYNSRSCEKEEKRNNLNKLKNNIFGNIDDLDALPIKNIDYIISIWGNSKLVLENFEKKISNKKDFEINFDTLDIKTKNAKACQELNDEKFWILYSEYLIKKHKVKNDIDFLKIINIAFSYLDCNCRLLIYYYYDKIKKLHPIIKDGKIEVKDEPYIELLDTPVKYRIKYIREKLKSDIKITSNQKINKSIHKFYEYTPTRNKFKKP